MATNGNGNGNGGVDDEQLKRIAAAAYDYDNDPRWPDYCSHHLIPCQNYFKLKFYQRYIDPDLVVEPMSSTNSSESGTPSSQPASETVRPASGRYSQSGHASGSASTGRNMAAMQLDQCPVHFSVNAWVLVLSVLGMLPIVPRHLSSKAYRLSLLGTSFSSLYSLYTHSGEPRACNLTAVLAWLQSIIATKDFIHMMYGLTFVTSKNPLKFALIPVFCWALEDVARFLRCNFTHSSIYRKYLEETCTWVEANGTMLSMLSSHAEIGLGFLLIVSPFSGQQNFIQILTYWQLLNLMYNTPVTAGYHRNVWAKIGRSANPYIRKYAPFFNRTISRVRRGWFR